MLKPGIIIIVCALSLGLWLALSQKDQVPEEQVISPSGTIIYIINNGEGEPKEYKLEASHDSTVFSLLEELAEKENFTIEASFYAELGFFIESIGDLRGGTDNKWWQYWVNGELSEVAADKKRVRAGETVEWRFEAPLWF